MADEEREEREELEDDEEDWTEPVDLDGLPNGNTTTFVGGFSACTSIGDALTQIKDKDDRIVVLPGTYTTDVALDSTLHKSVEILGDRNSEPKDIIFKGLLDVHFSQPPTTDADNTAMDEELDEASKKRGAQPPRPLTIGRMTFEHGGVFSELTECLVQECVFGVEHVDKETLSEENQVPRTVRVHGLSTVHFNTCTIYGTDRSAIYSYPHSRAVFDKCSIIGATKPPPPPPEIRRKLKKKMVEEPPPPPSVPASCECEVGIHADDGACKFVECTIRNFKMAVVCNDLCKGMLLTECNVSEVATTGILLLTSASPALKNITVKLCGRECIVVSKQSHPTMRGNTLVGDVRLARGSIGTGISDNVLALNGKLYDEEGVFSVKGFTTIATDPTLKKKRKPAAAEE